MATRTVLCVCVVMAICLVTGLYFLWYFHLQDSDLKRVEKLFSWSAEPGKTEGQQLQEGESVCCAVGSVYYCLILLGLEVEGKSMNDSSASLRKAERIVAVGVDWTGGFVWTFTVSAEFMTGLSFRRGK